MSKTPKKRQKTRAELAAERGVGIRTLQRNVAAEVALLPIEFRRHAAQGIMLASRVNTILPVLRDSKDIALLESLRNAITPGAFEALGLVAPEVLAAMELEDAAP